MYLFYAKTGNRVLPKKYNLVDYLKTLRGIKFHCPEQFLKIALYYWNDFILQKNSFQCLFHWNR